MHDLHTIVETERLILRNWGPADVDAFCSVCSDPRVMEFVGDGQPWSRETTQRFIERAQEMAASHGYCQWPLVVKASSQVIGFCGFVPASGGAEMGWRLAHASWGQGLATEAAQGVLRYGWETLGFSRVMATVQTANRPSRRVAEKLGMLPVSRIIRSGREIVLYSICAPAAPYRRAEA